MATLDAVLKGGVHTIILSEAKGLPTVLRNGLANDRVGRSAETSISERFLAKGPYMTRSGRVRGDASCLDMSDRSDLEFYNLLYRVRLDRGQVSNDSRDPSDYSRGPIVIYFLVGILYHMVVGVSKGCRVGNHECLVSLFPECPVV